MNREQLSTAPSRPSHRPGRPRRAPGRAVALFAVLGLAGTLAVPAAADVQDADAAPGTGVATAQPASQPSVEWGECPADVVAEALPTTLDCATVSVPLDYAEPDGARTDLMISRLASTDPAARRGILLLNPGGPGGSGLTQSTLLESQGLPDSVLRAYDLIGMDTRGVGHSTRVDCQFPADSAYYGNVPPYAVDDAAVLERAEVVREAAEQCARNDDNGGLYHLSTANTARDLDSIRAALGEEKASFLGYSYGTALGAAYVSMFPDTVDRVVLDSNVGDSHLNREGLRRFALGMEQTFGDFARWAAQRHDAYGLGRTPAQVRATYFETAERLDGHPVEGVDGGLFRQVIFGGLYSERTYGRTAQTWQWLRDGDGAAARDLLDAEVLPALVPGGAAPAEQAARDTTNAAVHPLSNALSVFLASTCNDSDWEEDVDVYRAAVAEDRKKFPLFGAAAANMLPCAYWPEPAEGPVQISDEGPGDVLILQNRRDPVTPLAGGQLLREKLGDRSRLVTVDGSGHGVYVLGGNACALNIGTRYLVDGELPARDTSCRAS
ncbi:alpha/beta hydrolase [Promicromonospora thailandica]|uniref:TAP-like protein n=1 Tax=Promicromonospora thailandica TaxID=765201 RepID=A0A9X2FX72_9MICO|nr:alpha/beta hydrolase [Promicromonospora thailandica]MCP2262942.1 TAP-like protein [Promicromonospora thailandica]